MQNTAMVCVCVDHLPTLWENLVSNGNFMFRKQRIHGHSVSHPGLQITPLDAHRGGSMSAASFSKNYDTRVQFWPIMFQNAVFLGKAHDPQDHVLYLYVFVICMHHVHSPVLQEAAAGEIPGQIYFKNTFPKAYFK